MTRMSLIFAPKFQRFVLAPPGRYRFSTARKALDVEISCMRLRPPRTRWIKLGQYENTMEGKDENFLDRSK